MDQRYARDYRQLYERHWWWRAREDLVLATLERLRPHGGWGRILDVGCGDGLLFPKLARWGEVEGIEMDPTGVDPAGRDTARIHLRPFDRTFRPARSYGLILMLDVLEHFDDPLDALQTAVGLLEPEGSIVLTVPAFLSLWTSHDDLNHHRTRFTRSRLTALVRQAGARLDRASYFFRWTVPIKLAGHFFEKVVAVEAAPPRVPPAWLNETLYRLSGLEQRLLGSVPLPFGSSLLAVASRGK